MSPQSPSPVRSRLILAVLSVAALIAVLGPAQPALAAIAEPTDGSLGYFPLASPAEILTTTVLTGGTNPVLDVAATGLAGVPSANVVSSVVLDVTVSAGTSSASVLVGAGEAADADLVAMPYAPGRTATSQIGTKVKAAGQTPSPTDGTVRIKTNAAAGQTVTVRVAVVGFHATQRGCWGNCLYHNRYQPAAAATVDDGLDANGAPELLSLTAPSKTIPIEGLAAVPAAATEVVVRINTIPPPDAKGLTRQLYVRSGNPNDNVTSLLGIVSFKEDVRSSRIITTRLHDNGSIQVVVPASNGQIVNGKPVYQNLPSPGEPHNDPHGVRTQLTVDVLGYFTADNAYAPVRTGASRTVVVKYGNPLALDLRGLDGLPVNGGFGGLKGAVLDVTVRNASKVGTVSMATGQRNVEIRPGDTTSAQVIVPIEVAGTTEVSYLVDPAQNPEDPDGPDGTDEVTIDYAIDGHYEWSENTGVFTGAKYTPITPTTAYAPASRVGANYFPHFPVTGIGAVGGMGGVPLTGVTTVALQIQAWGALGPTSITAYTPGRPTPQFPSVRVAPDRPTTQLVFADVTSNGRVGLVVGSSAVFVEAKVVGWFSPFVGDAPLNANGLPDDHALIVGDSITGSLTTPVFTTIADGAANRVLISGRAGHQAHEVRFFTNRLVGARPETFVANLGTNDAWIGLIGDGTAQAEKTKADLDRMLTEQATASCRYLVTINSWTLGRDDPNPATRAGLINQRIASLATTRPNVGIIDFDAYLREREDVANPPKDQVPDNDYVIMSDDGVHLKEPGRTELTSLYRYAITGIEDELPEDLAPRDFVTRCA